MSTLCYVNVNVNVNVRRPTTSLASGRFVSLKLKNRKLRQGKFRVQVLRGSY